MCITFITTVLQVIHKYTHAAILVSSPSGRGKKAPSFNTPVAKPRRFGSVGSSGRTKRNVDDAGNRADRWFCPAQRLV
ncbi:hypothetical protein SKAU_G00086690 [Synaphobranchus kaupii]|uniref:Uncharacterized protein n=1 Tax=Synaphobranchus kaupii TaxID=118154 RepID=A0A9Q1J620_SYNKA|nr:hypothetical protein SKAU_G00086690 [Synaphobranchus kaupii]